MQSIRLNNPHAITRLLNRSINQLLAEEITTDKARAIGYLCSVLIRAVETESIEDRMQAIEAQLNARAI